MNYLDKQLAKETKVLEPKKKNQKPEKETEKECLKWLKTNNFSISVVDSAAVYSSSRGGYKKGDTESGFSDLVGNDWLGRACFVELKARGKRKNLSPDQYTFLKSKIQSNCFAISTDTYEYLRDTYKEWASYADVGNFRMAQRYLHDQLPIPAKMKDDGKPLFEV